MRSPANHSQHQTETLKRWENAMPHVSSFSGADMAAYLARLLAERVIGLLLFLLGSG